MSEYFMEPFSRVRTLLRGLGDCLSGRLCPGMDAREGRGLDARGARQAMPRPRPELAQRVAQVEGAQAFGAGLGAVEEPVVDAAEAVA